MSVDLSPAHDFYLTINGSNYGFMLYKDPKTGERHWNEGLAPLMTPQQRVTEFSYEHIPPEIDVPAAFENWSDGAGITEYISAPAIVGLTNATSNAPKGYNYSQGIDLSWESRAYVSPARQADNASTGGAIAAAPTLFWYSSTFGLWCLASTTAYQYDLSSGTWVSRDTASGAYTSAAELNGVMYLSITSAAYHYSTNGTAWTTATLGGGLTNDIADLFTVRGNALWAIRSESLYTTTNGQNGGVNWSSATIVGSTSESTKSMLTANGEIWIFKREGIYTYDGTTVSDVWASTLLTSSNGTSAYLHADGRIYVVYESNILGIDPFNTIDTPIQVIYPMQYKRDASYTPRDSLEIKGSISQITGNFDNLFFTVTNAASRTYLLKCNPDTQIVHTYAYLGSNANSACAVVGAGVMHASNPCIATGYGTAAVHYILPRANMRPEDDANYEFDTTQGLVYGPWASYGARAFSKFLNRGTVLTLNTTAGQTVGLNYEIDNSGSTVNILTAVDPDLSTANVTTEVAFNRVRYYITMLAVGSSQSPILIAATLHATLNPPRRRLWRPIIILAPNIELRDGTRDNQDPSNLREVLITGVTNRCTLYDRHQRSYIVRLLDIQEQMLIPYEEGGDERDSQVFQLAIAEIYPQGTGLPGAIYGSDSWKVYV